MLRASIVVPHGMLTDIVVLLNFVPARLTESRKHETIDGGSVCTFEADARGPLLTMQVQFKAPL